MTLLEVMDKAVGEGAEDDEDICAFFKLWDYVDKDGNGVLTRFELWEFMKSIDYQPWQEMTWEVFLDRVYSRCLKETRGNLYDKFTRDDFVKVMEECMMAEFFREADTDGDGIVTFEEIVNAWMKIGHENVNYSEIAAMKMLYDTEVLETDEVLSMEEFSKKLEDSVFASGNFNFCTDSF